MYGWMVTGLGTITTVDTCGWKATGLSRPTAEQSGFPDTGNTTTVVIAGSSHTGHLKAYGSPTAIIPVVMTITVVPSTTRNRHAIATAMPILTITIPTVEAQATAARLT